MDLAFPGLGTICFAKDLTNAFVIASLLSNRNSLLSAAYAATRSMRHLHRLPRSCHQPKARLASHTMNMAKPIAQPFIHSPQCECGSSPPTCEC